MSARTSHRFLSAIALCTALFIPAVGRAVVYQLHGDFDGLQMVPPNSSPAFGSTDATLDSLSGTFSITTGTYQDLLGGANSVFVNVGDPGTSGPFVMTLTLDTPGASTGTFSGGGTLTAGQITDFLADKGYIRIASAVFPSGEIRAQLFVTTVPEARAWLLVSVATVGLWFTTRRRSQ